jgi:hypothetical protein
MTSTGEEEQQKNVVFAFAWIAAVVSGFFHFLCLGYCAKLLWDARTRRNIGFVTLLAISTLGLVLRIAQFWANGLHEAEYIAPVTMYILRIFLIHHFSGLLLIIVCINPWLNEKRIKIIKITMLVMNCVLSLPLLFPLIPLSAHSVFGRLLQFDASLLGISDVILSGFELFVIVVFSRSMYSSTLKSKNFTVKHKKYVRYLLWGQLTYGCIVVISLTARLLILRFRNNSDSFGKYIYLCVSNMLTFFYFMKHLLVPLISINATLMRLGPVSETDSEVKDPVKPLVMNQNASKKSEFKISELETMKLP